MELCYKFAPAGCIHVYIKAFFVSLSPTFHVWEARSPVLLPGLLQNLELTDWLLGKCTPEGSNCVPEAPIMRGGGGGVEL